MKQIIKFYLDGQEIEFNELPDILYSYKVTDLTNPVVVYNSYSKTITIPGTPNNNQIFGGIWNLNRSQLYGGTGTVYFDPSKKSTFVIFLNGEIYESGYAKLTNIKRNSHKIEYEIDLYGGLGSMFYNLSYKVGTNTDDGEAGKLKLSDLYYRYDDTSVNERNEFNFKINKDAIFDAWVNETPYASDSYLWHYINFMPCYNGYPENFSSDKALINWNNLPQGDGMVSGITKDGNTYISYNGYSLATLPQKITEWEAKDLRSYLQRPVLRVKGLFKAIKEYVARDENGGYDLVLDNDFFNTDNLYYEDAWITLPLLTEYENSNQSESTAVLVSDGSTTGGTATDKKRGSWTEFHYDISGLTESDRTGDISVKFTPTVNATADASLSNPNSYYLFNVTRETGEVSSVHNMTQIYYQLLAYDSDDNIITGSDISVLYTNSYTDFGYTPDFNSKSTNLVNGYFSRNGSTNTYSFTKDIVLNVTCNTYIDHIGIKAAAITKSDKNNYLTNKLFFNLTSISTANTGSIQSKGVNNLGSSITLSNNGSIRSNNLITKKILLDTEYSPAEYLLSYCKIFGLYFYKEPDTNKIYIMDRNTFYKRNEVVDLNEYIDRSKEIKITPVAFENKYYDFDLAAKGGEFETQYESTSSIPYGMKRVNTGYNFNRESKDLYENNCYHGALECLEKSKYNFENVGGKGVFLYDGAKYNLYRNNLEESTEVEINVKDWSNSNPINTDYKYYDVFSKVQLHDADNKSFDGSNCLVFHLGTDWTYGEIDNGFYWVSDDVPEMDTLNNDTPCWLISNSGETATIEGINRVFAKSDSNQRIAEQYTYLPHFGRYKVSSANWVTRSWDFGSPRTTYIPDTIYRDSSTIYNAFWKSYISDMYNIDTRILNCYVRLTERPNPEWLRRFYWFDNAIWRLNAISDWDISSFETTKMEFVKVQDRNNYRNEVISNYFTPRLTASQTTIPSTGATIQVNLEIGDGGSWYLSYDDSIVTSEVDEGTGPRTFNVTIGNYTGTTQPRTITITATADYSSNLVLTQENVVVPSNYILYTSTDGQIVTPYMSGPNIFGANIVSNTYVDGVGRLGFDADVTMIGYSAFKGCSTLSSITIPSSVTTLGSYAFERCYGLSTIDIPSNVTRIDTGAFFNNTGLTSIVIPNSVTTLSDGIFAGCEYLTAATLPNSVTRIAYQMFDECFRLQSFDIPSSVTSIQLGAFRSCRSLSSITIPNGVTTIENEAFKNCTGLTSINIPNAVQTIGNESFRGCIAVSSSITIPSSVTQIGNYAFADMANLRSVTCDGDTPATIGSSIFLNDSLLSEIWVPYNSLQAYKTAWSEYESIIKAHQPVPTGDTYILYTSNNGQIVTPYTAGTSIFGANIVSNTYEDGVGKITFDGPVTKIGSWAFGYKSTLSTINIPSSVTSIGYGAFGNCTGLSAITIPSSVTSINRNICRGSNMSSLIVENGNYFYDSRNNCNAIIETATNTLICGCKDTIIPNTITTIGEDSFAGIESMSSITIPNSVTSIGDDAFNNCNGLISINIPNSVTSIGDYAFSYCTGLTSVTLSNAITTINSNTFFNCSSLTGISIPNSVTSIGDDAFNNCESLTSISLGNSVTTIGERALAYCRSLTSINIPNAVQTIGEEAFRNCIAISTFTIPASVTSIGDEAFADMTSLSSVTCNGATPATIGSSIFLDDSLLTEIWVPYNSLQAYKTAWSEYESIIKAHQPVPTGDTYILYTSNNGQIVTPYTAGTSIFGANIVSNTYEDGVGKITFDDNVTMIGQYAFYNRTGLTSVIIPESVTTIGDTAFHSCYGLTSVTIPSSVNTIGPRSFTSCIALTSVTIPNSVTSIGEFAFDDCDSISSVTIPSSVTTIGREAFSLCRDLRAVYCDGSTPATLGNDAFRESKTLIWVPANSLQAYKTAWSAYENIIYAIGTIPSGTNIIQYTSIDNSVITPYTAGTSVFGSTIYTNYNIDGTGIIYFNGDITKIGKDAFQFCSGLTSMIIPSAVTIIDDFALAKCSNLSAVTLPNSLLEISERAFWYDGALQTIEFPSSLKIIGIQAFSSCSGLTSIVTPPYLTSLYNTAFAGCTSLTSATFTHIGYAVSDIPDFCFSGCENLTNFNITNPNALYVINSYAFADCKSLSAITIPSNVENIYTGAFNGCYVTSENFINNSGLVPEAHNYWGATICDEITDDRLAINLDYELVKALDTSITSCTIPSINVTGITYNAFSGCTDLRYMTFEGNPPTLASSESQYALDYLNLIAIYVPSNLVNLYKARTDYQHIRDIIQPIPE